jgi:hypothetical protein
MINLRTGNVARMREMKDAQRAYTILTEKHEANSPLERNSHRWKDIIKMVLK